MFAMVANSSSTSTNTTNNNNNNNKMMNASTSYTSSSSSSASSHNTHRRGFVPRATGRIGLRLPPPAYVPLRDRKSRGGLTTTATAANATSLYSGVVVLPHPSPRSSTTKPASMHRRCQTEGSESGSATTHSETLSLEAPHSTTTANDPPGIYQGIPHHPIQSTQYRPRPTNISNANHRPVSSSSSIAVANSIADYTGPVDVDSGTVLSETNTTTSAAVPRVHHETPPSTGDCGPVDVDSCVFSYSDVDDEEEFRNDDVTDDDNGDSWSYNSSGGLPLYDECDTELFRELVGYEVGFEPSIITQVVDNDDNEGEDDVPAVAKQGSFLKLQQQYCCVLTTPTTTVTTTTNAATPVGRLVAHSRGYGHRPEAGVGSNHHTLSAQAVLVRPPAIPKRATTTTTTAGTLPKYDPHRLMSGKRKPKLAMRTYSV